MSAFASKTPEQIGCTCYWTDPSTWFYHYGAVEPGSQMEPNPECFEHFPHVQHNEPNPILVAFRASDLGADNWYAAIFATEIYGGHRAWEVEGHEFQVLTKATAEQLDHADRVLELVLA